jgi:YggT family protein
MIEALFASIISVVIGVLELYKWVIIIHALMSWINPDPYNQIVQIINRLTQPSYRVVRKYIPTTFGGIDITPIVIIFAIVFLETFLTRLFY